VEYDPASQWYNASITIIAGWLKAGGRVGYDALAQPPDDVRARLRRLGLELDHLEREKKIFFNDWYTLMLGQKSKENDAPETLKVPELSIRISQGWMRGPSEPDKLAISDDESRLARFNDEKAWVELELTRYFELHL
jgi:hypothetical protein